MPEKAIEVEDLSKRFGAVWALTGVSFELKDDETIGLVGDNGAGKSTLIKVLGGVLKPTAVRKMCFFGREHIFSNPNEARKIGIETVHQNLALADQRSLIENFFMGRELKRNGLLGKVGIADLGRMKKETGMGLRELGVTLDVERQMRYFSGGQRQIVTLARSLYTKPRILFLDEPTTALSAAAEGAIIDILNTLRGKLPIMYISHNLKRVLEVSDRVMILRHGEKVVLEDSMNFDVPGLVRSMLEGRD